MNVCISYHVNILCHIMLFYMYIIIFTTSSKHITSSLQLSKYILETLSNNVSTRNLRGSLHTGIRTSIYSRDSNTYVTYHFTFPISIRSQVEQMLMILWKNWLRQCRQGVTKEFRTNSGSTISYQLGVASVSQLCGVTHNVILFMIIIHFRSSGRSGTSDFKPDSKSQSSHTNNVCSLHFGCTACWIIFNISSTIHIVTIILFIIFVSLVKSTAGRRQVCEQSECSRMSMQNVYMACPLPCVPLWLLRILCHYQFNLLILRAMSVIFSDLLVLVYHIVTL